MIQGLIVKIIIKSIMKAINKKHNLKKIDDYVNKDNELDVEIRSILRKINKLEKDSHPQTDWICMKCGCNAKRVKKPTGGNNG
jgi:uncharacterized protein YeeX (DUF496 family)